MTTTISSSTARVRPFYVKLNRPNTILGQIELYTHHGLLPKLLRHFQLMNVRTCGVYLLESQFMEDRYKYFA